MSKGSEKKDEKAKNPVGRPSDYTPEAVELVCALIATNAKGMRRLAEENPEMPAWATIKRWMFKHPEFRARYLQAKEVQSHVLMDSTLDIANRDEYEDDDSLLKINRDKLKIDTYKFNATRLNAKDYGEKKEYKHEMDVSETKNRVEKNVNEI